MPQSDAGGVTGAGTCEKESLRPLALLGGPPRLDGEPEGEVFRLAAASESDPSSSGGGAGLPVCETRLIRHESGVPGIEPSANETRSRVPPGVLSGERADVGVIRSSGDVSMSSLLIDALRRWLGGVLGEWPRGRSFDGECPCGRLSKYF